MKTIILGLAGVGVVAGGIYWTSNSNTYVKKVVMEKGENAMEKVSHAMEKTGDTVMEKVDNGMIKDNSAMIKKSGSFVKLVDTDISKLSGKIVLDFSATWCPACQTIKKDIEASLSGIPSDVTIVLVDYDANQDLRVKYGVTGQHTFVQVNSDGEKIKLWRGGITLEDILAQIQ